MKNILIFTHPLKKFNEETAQLVRLQIDNSYELGWKKEDIILVTNFDYEYNEIKSIVIPYLRCEFDPTSNKIPVIVYLLQNNMLPDNLYWYHDFDAYQNVYFDPPQLNRSFALCMYGYKPEWQCGGFFFYSTAQLIFQEWVNRMLIPRTRADEKTMKNMMNDGWMEDKFEELNVSYNFTFRYVHRNYPKAEKPLKVVHFHPYYKDILMKDRALDIFLGKNKLNIPLMSDRLIKIFNYHGIK